MAKSTTRFVCQQCGAVSARWTGHCPNCDGWNTVVEETIEQRPVKSQSIHPSSRLPKLSEIETKESPRLITGLGEVDRVLGGGLVPGSVVFIGGDPGIGKSTMMLQLASQLTTRHHSVMYITGEESIQQVKLRSERLSNYPSGDVLVAGETSLPAILGIIESGRPDCVIIDSIQTVYHPDFESAPGSVSQVRESTARLLRVAKEHGSAIIIIGHVTKEGVLAGPKTIEHMVDAVLQLEGDRHYTYRILRALKNRFGSTNEIGVFEMHDDGLREVSNPSELFLSERSQNASGTVIVGALEGSRSILIEVQALIAPASYGVPQRTSTGIDSRRLAILLAILERRAAVHLSTHDVFVNVVGGMRIDEPATDLGTAIAIVSSLRDSVVEPNTVIIGELGLAGEVRAVGQIEKRVDEAAKLGFQRAVIPAENLRGMKRRSAIACEGVDSIQRGIEVIFGGNS